MSATYRIRVTQEAQTDLLAIENYIFANSPQNAESVKTALESAINSLNVFPQRFKIFQAHGDPSKIVRSLPARPFLIFYRVLEAESAVEILTVRHGARDQPQPFL